MCLDQTELANNYLRGFYNSERFTYDNTLINLSIIISKGKIHCDVSSLINNIKIKLLKIIESENEDKYGIGKKLVERNERLKNLTKEMKSYN